MIPFFRKIRKQFADDNKPLKYMRYAIGEIVLVMVGILLALQVNNWNEGRKQEEQYNAVLEQLYNSVSKDVWMANHTLAYTNNQIEIIDELLARPESFQIEKLIHILYYLDTETYFESTSDTEYNFSLLRSSPENDIQNKLSKLISNYVSYLRNERAENKEELSYYLHKMGVAIPIGSFGLTAMGNFESVDTTYFTKSEKEKVKLFMNSNQFEMLLRSLKSRKEMLFFSANQGKNDAKSINTKWGSNFYYDDLKSDVLKGKRFGAFKGLMEDSLYVNAISVLKKQGADVIEIEEEKVELPDFLRLLNLDMKKDLPVYLSTSANPSLKIKSVQDVIEFNKKDSLNIMPYGQKLFKGIVADNSTDAEFESIKQKLKTNGRLYLDTPMQVHNLDGVLSINNYHAGFAAVAEYPALTVPMGYAENAAPKGLTFIAKPLQEKLLLQWAYAYEQASKMRQA